MQKLWKTSPKQRLILVLSLLSYLAVGSALGGQLVDLKCDYRDTPMAVDRVDPLLSWRLEGERRELAQQAYQIQAASEPDGFENPDFWDTGWIEDVQSAAIPYAGKPFSAKQRVYWRVRIKDDQGTTLPWSAPTFFDGGLLEEDDWQGAEWISCPRKIAAEYAPSDVMGPWIAAAGGKTGKVTFKHEFSLPDKLVVYAGTWWNHVDKGQIELVLNGRKGLQGTEGPPSIHYKDFGFYLKPEGNEVSVTLDKVDAQTPISVGIRVVFADGSEQLIQSSADWQVEFGKNKEQATVVCQYGAKPLGEAKISPRAPLPVAWYKKDFSIAKTLESARLYICGLGYNEAYLNGEKIGDHVMDPGQTDYEHFAHYQVFDVKEHLKDGGNSLAVLLGDGWYNNDRWFSHSRHLYGKPGLKAMMEIRYDDGSSEFVVTDESWRWKPSGLMMSSVFMGDHMDYRKWHEEWKTPGTPAGWKAVKKVKALSPKLIAQDFPAIRIVEEIEPVKTWQVGEKTWIVDLGQNISGWIALDFEEAAGTTIRIRASEMLEEDGKTMDNVPESFWYCHAAPQNHSIIADGKPRSWRPYFSYHGFRYAEISGLSTAPKPGQIKGLFVYTDAPATASFKSSDPLLDRIFDMGIRSHHGNMHSILEDCPHREKCMWGGDLHSSWATGFYTLDSATFYRQQVRLFYTPPFDPIGIPGRIGVGKRSTNKTLDLTWSVSPLFLAWRNFQINGDLQGAADHYDEMVNFLRYFEEKSPDLIPHIYRYGDHAPPIGIPRTPADPQLIAAFNFYAAAERFADIAGGLGKTKDADWSRELAARIRESILKKYYDSKNKTFGNGTHDSLALEFGIVDGADREAVAASLAKIYQENGKKFDGGFMSYNIYPQLTEHGHVDLALEMLRNPEYPGLAQSIRDYDATTIFERFIASDRDKQFRQSLNHHAMNHPTAWLINYLAGIRQDPTEAGFRKVLLSPHIPKDLEWVEAEMETAYGLVKSAWKQEAGEVRWSFTIPPNSVAELRLPKGLKAVQLDGKDTPLSDGRLELPSGSYQAAWARVAPEQAKAGNAVLRPPAGRLAIVIDGNSPDPDDIGATAVMFGLLNKAGLNDRLVHLSHSCDLKPVNRISAEDELRRQQVLDQLCRDGIRYYGPFENLKQPINCRQDQEAAVNDLRDAINASAADDPLWIIEAGEPDIIGFALRKSDPAKIMHVHVVSHHPANDDSGDFFEWHEILEFGVKEHQIGDQNVHLQTPIEPWDWAKGHDEPGIAWIWECLQYAEQDGVVKFQTNKFDCSDAGMIYWWITGADQGGEKLSTADDIKAMLLRQAAAMSE